MKKMVTRGGAAAPPADSINDHRSHPFFDSKLTRILLRFLMLAVMDAFAVMFIWTLLANGRYPLAACIFFVTIMINVVYLVEKAYPFRWFAPGLTLMIIMLLYPTAYTVYIAFTNYGDGHLLTKAQVIDRLESITYVPEDAQEYTWTAFRNTRGEFILLVDDGRHEFIALPGQPFISLQEHPNLDIVFSDSGVPETIKGYRRLTRAESLRYLDAVGMIEFGAQPETIRVRSLDAAQRREQRYHYDRQLDVLVDQLEGTVFSPVQGLFTSEEGRVLRPGFWVVIGTRNFVRLFTSPALRGPFVRVFIWTFVFSFTSVLLTFSFGLFFAIMFNHPKLPYKRLIRSLLLIPYALPAFISVNIWRSMFSRHFGIISTTLESLFGSSPLWLADPFWAKIGILVIQTWLGFPYMMLICTGALQSLPADIYEAATIDGAGPFRKFLNMTLPLLLVTVGPLLLASFAFNFNNFTVIDIYAEGGPPIAESITPAGHTDILITYIFRLAFSGGRGADFGYASAITIVIFIMLALITALQFKYTRIWEEISENV